MKKIFLFIIMIVSTFSIESTFAKENGLLEDILNLKYGPITYDLNLEKLNTYHFKDANVRETYENLLRYDEMIRDEIIYQYKLGNYSTATIKGIVKNYKNFVYYTNKLFYFFQQIDAHPSLTNDVDIQEGILNSYKNSASYYKKVKDLVNKTQK